MVGTVDYTAQRRDKSAIRFDGTIVLVFVARLDFQGDGLACSTVIHDQVDLRGHTPPRVEHRIL